MIMHNSVFLRLSINYGSFFLYAGILMPYLGLWLKNKGLEASEIGIIIAMPHVMKIITAPIISQIADSRGEYWRPLMVCSGLSLILFSLYFIAEGFFMIFCITFAINLFMPAMMPLFETITISQVKKHNLNYGRIRAIGSITFILSSVTIGWLLKDHPIDYVIIGTFGALVSFFITATFLPRGNKKTNSMKKENNNQESPIKVLISNQNFVLLLIIVGLLQMSHGVYYSMGTIYWKDNSISEDVIGLLWAFGIAAEICVFLFFDKYMSRLNLWRLLAVIGFFGIIRWYLISQTFSLPILFGAQLIHGLTYGATHLIAIRYIGHYIPSQYSATAQSLYTALPLGLAMAFSTYVGGVLYGEVGGQAYYAMCLICIIAILSTLYSFRLKN